MVVIERRKLAEVEDELENARAEREALKAALRVVENGNISHKGESLAVKGSSASSLQTFQPDNRSSVTGEPLQECRLLKCSVRGTGLTIL